MSPQEEERRGMEAQVVLENGVYKESYRVIRDNIVSQLSLADLADDKRQRLNNLLVALAKVEQYMKQVMVSGTMAAMQIERERTLADRLLRR
jgi:hypothetical protein